MFGDVQFAGRIAQSCDYQHHRHERPRHRFTSEWDQPLKEIGQTQAFEQCKPQPGPTEFQTPLDADALSVHLHPGWLRILKQHALIRLTRRLLAHPATYRRFRLTQIRNHPLTRPARRAVRLHQGPVAMTLAVLVNGDRANIHAPIVGVR